MTDKKLSTLMIEKYDSQSYIMENMDIMFSGAYGQLIWYGSFFFCGLLLWWAPWVFAIPFVINECITNGAYFCWKRQDRESRRDKWYSTFNTHNWMWFWRTQKHRVNYNVTTSYDKEKDHVSKFLSTLKKRDWMCSIEQAPDNIDAEPIVYVSFRKQQDAIYYKMIF